MDHDRRDLAISIVFTVFIVIFIAAIEFLIDRAQAHVKDADLSQFAQNYLNQQKIPKGMGAGTPCCSQADASLVEEDIRNGQYWVRCALDSPCPIKVWTPVPDEAVIKEPNMVGHPIVWWYNGTYENGVPTTPAGVRCFLPGAGL